MMVASQIGHIDIVNVLLQHGASVQLDNEVNLITRAIPKYA